MQCSVFQVSHKNRYFATPEGGRRVEGVHLKISLDDTLYKVYYILMSGKDFVKLLKKNGWILDRIKGSHHIMRKNRVSLSVPVHANEDLKSGILNFLKKQAGLE
jgi:predicted RNA binding protein YcfA (HicA-like mRNA interferase family)